jgi:hypothetical protein
MKFFLFLVLLALIVGAIFHEDVAAYIRDAANGPTAGAGVGSSVQSMGNSSNSLFNSVGNAF